MGRIDLLAKHRRAPKWLVVELKSNRTSDQTVGQILRYTGWVLENLAAPGEEVTGMIVAQDTDEHLRYAVATYAKLHGTLVGEKRLQLELAHARTRRIAAFTQPG